MFGVILKSKIAEVLTAARQDERSKVERECHRRHLEIMRQVRDQHAFELSQKEAEVQSLVKAIEARDREALRHRANYLKTARISRKNEHFAEQMDEAADHLVQLAGEMKQTTHSIASSAKRNARELDAETRVHRREITKGRL